MNVHFFLMQVSIDNTFSLQLNIWLYVSKYFRGDSQNETELASGEVHSVRPKLGFGIGNRNQGPISVSVSEPNFFFSETETFFKFFSFFSLLGGIQVFLSLKIN